jgi:8-oxo-dGTP pyrophosphatase MutT (NUDIX family)
MMAIRHNALDRVKSVMASDHQASSDFDLNSDIILPADRVLRDAGVLMLIEETAQGPFVYLTKRASHLKHHPGQIAFPGGKADPEDADQIDTALREANEEIGLPPTHVEILGQLAPHETVTGFRVKPVVGLLTHPFDPILERTEVDELFRVPLHYVLNLQNFSIEERIWNGLTRKYYVVPFGPYYIWGATARMFFGLAQKVSS